MGPADEQSLVSIEKKGPNLGAASCQLGDHAGPPLGLSIPSLKLNGYGPDPRDAS